MKKLVALLLAVLMCVGVFAGCGNKSNPGLEDAKEYLDTVMKSGSESTPADYALLNQVTIGKDKYTIEWSVNVNEGVKVVVAENGDVSVDVNERTPADIAYVLTATIKSADGKTIIATYNRKVPAFKELTWAEFTATEDDAAVVISGVITGIVNTETKHELYLEDADGGYYVYNLSAEKMEGLAIGMEIRVLGIRDTYYGVNQIIDASVEIINSELKPVTPTDITEALKSAANLKESSLHAFQSMLVTVKGATVIGQDKSNDTYYNFAIDGKQTYVRISGTANMLSEADTETFKNNVADNIGKSATVTGVVSIYNNQIYLIPVTVDAYADFAIVERTPAEQVEFEKSLMEALGTITEAGKITLPTAVKLYNDVTITWSLAETTFATLDGTTLNIAMLPDDEQTITLTATFTNGDASVTKEFTVKISAAPTLVADIVKTPAANTTYKFYIKQNNTKQTLYFAGYDKGLLVTTDPTKAVDVGLEPVPGKDGEYYFYYMVGTAKSYIIVSVEEKEENGKAKLSYTISESRYNTGSNTYKYNAELNMLTTTLTGTTLTETYWFGTYSTNAKLGVSATSYINASNCDVSQFPARFGTLVDTETKTDAEKVEREKNDLTINTEYKNADSQTLPAYGELFAKVTITWAVDAADTTGAVVIEDGVLKAVPQAEDATVKVIATIKHGEVTDTKEFNVTVAKKAIATTITIAEALAATDNTEVVVRGVVTEINQAWNDQYGNITVTIADSTGTLYVYRMKTNVKVGDIITITGKMATYNGSRQIAQGATAVIEGVDALTVEDALKLADNAEVVVMGTVTEINQAWSEQYGNITVTISDATGTLYVYRMKANVKLGDVVIITGKMATYNGNRQIAQGATAVVLCNVPLAKEEVSTVTIAEAKALEDGTTVIIKVTVKSIDEPYSDQYKNITVTVTDATGELYLYRLKANVAVGDEIIITGKITTYNGVKQISGATIYEEEA